MTAPVLWAEDFYDDVDGQAVDAPHDLLDMSRVPSSQPLPFDVDVMGLLTGPDGLASKPQAHDIAEALIAALVSALVQGLTGVVGGILDLIGSLFDTKGKADAATLLLFEQAQQLVELADRQQVLEGVLGYGAWTRKLKKTIDGEEGLATDMQVGPRVGVSHSGGVVTFHSRGLWNVKARALFTTTRALKLQANAIALNIEISNDGFSTIYYKVPCEIPPHTSGATATLEDYYGGTIILDEEVVLPEPGYQMRVRIASYPLRNNPGGIGFNRISVNKLDSALGPGMRLTQPAVLGASWQVVGPMLTTGGAAAASGNGVLIGDMTTARVDAESTGTALYDLRITRNGVAVATSTNKLEHKLVWSGAVAAGSDALRLEARSTAGATINAQNATWLTFFNSAQYASDE